MDELMEMFDTFIGDALQLERAMEDEFKDFEKKLNDCVSQANDRGTPVQNKKRPKRQASISENDESTSASRPTGSTANKEGTRKQSNDMGAAAPAVVRSSARMLDVNGGTAPNGSTSVAAEPTLQAMETAPCNESFVRPSRMARLKAQENLKEQSLITKLRNDSNVTIVVKKERPSKVEMENDANFANRNEAAKNSPHLRKDDGLGSTTESSEKDEPMAREAAGREASLVVIPMVAPKVEILSDEEMPPPKMPPPKMPAPQKIRTKKKITPKSDTLSDATAPSSAESSILSSSSSSIASSSAPPVARRTRGRAPKMATKLIVPIDEDAEIEPVRVKTEKLSIAQTELPQLHVEPTKAARCSDKSVYEDAHEGHHEEQVDGQDEKNEEEQHRVQMHPAPPSNVKEQPQIRPLKVVLEKLVSKAAPESAVNSPASIMNGTYTTAPHRPNETYDVPPTIQDGTFTVNSPPNRAPCNETFNIPTEEVVVAEAPTGSVTVTLNTHKNLANASIMTEDDSVIENSPNQAPVMPTLKLKHTTIPAAVPPVSANAKTNKTSSSMSAGALKKVPSSTSSSVMAGAPSSGQAAQAKGNKELFNPCIMSPIKSRIQAFEKCATTGTLTKSTTSSVGTPQARIGGRVLKTISTSLATTPQFSTVESLGSTARSAHAKETMYTPNCIAQPLVKASSASKIHQMQSKALHSKLGGGAGTMAGSIGNLSRESSCDRAGGGTLSAASSTSSLLDEKKKKREEKQRLAALQREALEREKREHAERLLREKEEKYRKLLYEKQEKLRIDATKKAKKQEEFEKRRQLEDQRALADLKREELAKQLEQQRIDRELLETLKQSQMKEHQETKLHKQLYQQKLRQQQQEQQLQQQTASKKKAAAAAQSSKTFKFEMIDTDDTTDDEESEDATARKKKRPTPPEWCRNTAEFRKALTIQAQVDTKVVDRLFSVQPMTPDLRLLFPSIDAQKLKRNSSAIWRTPPRYSQLP